jgi:hypothetical protein
VIRDWIRWWPAAPACLILWLGGASFLDKYPGAAARRADRITGSGPDSLLALARQSAADTVAAAPSENPFRPIHAPRPSGSSAASGVRVEPPPRRYVLKGTVGSDVATITNHGGQRLIVKAGDAIDSAEVVSIEPNKVVLKDRAGRFELLLEK